MIPRIFSKTFLTANQFGSRVRAIFAWRSVNFQWKR